MFWSYYFIYICYHLPYKCSLPCTIRILSSVTDKFRFSNLVDILDPYDSQMMYLALVKWDYSLYLWEQLIDCLMLTMRRFTLRECHFTKERYTLQKTFLLPMWPMTFTFWWSNLEALVIWKYCDYQHTLISWFITS